LEEEEKKDCSWIEIAATL